MLERVAKSRVSDRSGRKKSDSGRAGIPKSRIRVPKKSDILSGIMHFLPQIVWVFSKSRVRVGVGYLPDLKSRVRVAQK